MAAKEKRILPGGVSAWFSPENMPRFTRTAVILSLTVEVSGHIIDQVWKVPHLYNALTLLGVFILMLPAVLLVSLVQEKPFVRIFLVLAGIGLSLTVILDWTKDIPSLRDWALIGITSNVRGHLRWVTLVGGIFMLFASIYQAIGELVASRQKLQVEQQGLLQEMRQRRQAEEEAQAARDYAQRLIQTANVIVIGLDAEQRLQVFNEEAERITGYSRSELPDTGWFDILVPPERFPYAKRRMLESLHGGLSKHLEGPLTTKSGEDRLIAWSNTTIYEGGVFVGTISFGLDVTDRKKAEAELQRSSKLAALGVVAAGLAHEIGNPLASLSARLRLMEEDADPVFWRESIEVLEQQISRISRIVRGVSRFSRPVHPGLTGCNVNVLVAEALDVVRFHRQAKRCEIGTELAVHLPVVMAAADQLVQVFLNLGLNALEAMPEGGTLTIGTRYVAPYVEVSFRDTGVGVSEEGRQRLFDPFYTTKEEGMGLGLSIARTIVTNHQGRIECEDSRSGGTCFRVLIPAFDGTTAQISADGDAI